MRAILVTMISIKVNSDFSANVVTRQRHHSMMWSSIITVNRNSVSMVRMSKMSAINAIGTTNINSVISHVRLAISIFTKDRSDRTAIVVTRPQVLNLLKVSITSDHLESRGYITKLIA